MTECLLVSLCLFAPQNAVAQPPSSRCQKKKKLKSHHSTITSQLHWLPFWWRALRGWERSTSFPDSLPRSAPSRSPTGQAAPLRMPSPRPPTWASNIWRELWCSCCSRIIVQHLIIPQHLVDKLGPLDLNSPPYKLVARLPQWAATVSAGQTEHLQCHHPQHGLSSGLCPESSTVHFDDTWLHPQVRGLIRDNNDLAYILLTAGAAGGLEQE